VPRHRAEPQKLSTAQRRWRHARRRLIAYGVALAVLGGLVAGERMGLFTADGGGDVDRYHQRSFRVKRVVDGDTLIVDAGDPFTGEAETRIRLLGVDAPESVHPTRPPDYYGPEASGFAERLAEGKTVTLRLVAERTRGHHDRLLAYVTLPDGTMLNRALIAEGYGYADPRFAHPLKQVFRSTQREARRRRLGLWKDVTRSQLPHYYRNVLDLGAATKDASPPTTPQENRT
jgi:endonuclease YncB( thermonuclease family)